MEYCGKRINKILHQIFEINEKVYILGEDIKDPYGGAFKITYGLSTKFPERVINTPISEAGITGFATGMSIGGKIPIVEIMFGDFLTLTFDQVLNHLTKFNLMNIGKNNIRTIIRTPMGGFRGYGPTHSQSLEKYYAGIPGLQMVAISDIHNLDDLYNNSIFNEKKPVILIENKSVYSSLYRYDNLDGFNIRYTDEKYPSAILNKTELQEYDLTIICYGGISTKLREIINKRDEMNQKIQLVVLSNLNNTNFEILKEDINKSKNLLIIEECNEPFGLSAEYAFRIRKYYKENIHRFGAKDYIIPNCKHLENEILPSEENINNKINEILK